jgi:putative nucleotidyltransferase with HDIG domain
MKESRQSMQAVIQFYLAIASMRQDGIREHSIRVAVMAAKAAVKLKYDVKAAYMSGILHDVGKLALPPALFDGHNVSEEEYSIIKDHVRLGYEALKDKYLFAGLIAGLHHSLGETGYGLTLNDLPKNLSMETAKKILDIAGLIAICDYVDAATNRKTLVLHGSGATIRDALVAKYPNNILVIDTVLGLAKK